jgi:hypothetical protein
MSELSLTDAKEAGRLIYKALHVTLTPNNDLEYKRLLGRYRAEIDFARIVESFAEGMELNVLTSAVTERGLVIVPTSRESKFAVRMTDIRTGLDNAKKAALLLAHVAIAATFFPTTDVLEDDNFVPPPSSIANFRKMLYGLAKELQATAPTMPNAPTELEPGWNLIASMPVMLPNAQRADSQSVVGFIRIALNGMREGNLVRVDERFSENDENATYTPTHRLRVQLRDMALRRLFDIAQRVIASTNSPFVTK